MKNNQISFHETYNKLQDVECADKTLSSAGRNELLDILGNAIIRHDLQNVIGIRLLHSHNEIDGNEIMLEEDEIDNNGKYLLSTIATEFLDIVSDYTANSWKYINGDFQPLEYSKDSLVTCEPNIIDKNKNFFNEFGSILETLAVSDILGPCIIRRDFYRKHRPEIPFILVETTEISRRANILQFENENKFNPDSLIQTTWIAVNKKKFNDSAVPYCPPNCIPGACNPSSYCEKDGNGGHKNVKTHTVVVPHKQVGHK